MTGGGLGAVTTTAQFPGTAIDGVYVAASGDGGTASDYRAYLNVGAPIAASTGTYAAGTDGTAQNNTNAYYSSNGFGGVQAPTAQTGLFGSQTGTTMPGSLGSEWHTWTISRVGDTVTWSVTNRLGTDVLIATIDASGETFAGDNIFLGQFDITGGSSADPNSEFLQFGLIDNVVVFTPVPEPAGLLARGALAVPVWLRLRGRRA